MDARSQAIERLYRERFAGFCDALSTATGVRSGLLRRTWAAVRA